MVVRIIRRGQSGLPSGEQGKKLLQEYEQRKKEGRLQTGTGYFYEDVEKKYKQQTPQITGSVTKQPILEPTPTPQVQKKGVGLSTAFATGGASIGTFIIDPYIKTNVYSDIERRYLTREELKNQQIAKLPTSEKIAYVGGALAASPIVFGGIHPKTAEVQTITQQTSAKTTRSASKITIGKKEVYTTTKGIHSQPSSATVIKEGKIIPKGTIQSGFKTNIVAGGKGTYLGEQKTLIKGAETIKPFAAKGTVAKVSKLPGTVQTQTYGLTTTKAAVYKTSIVSPKFGYIKGYSEGKAILLAQGESLPKVISIGTKAGAATTSTTQAITAAQAAQASAIGAKLEQLEQQ